MIDFRSRQSLLFLITFFFVNLSVFIGKTFGFDMYMLPEMSRIYGWELGFSGFSVFKYAVYPVGAQYKIPYHATSFYRLRGGYGKGGFYMGVNMNMLNFSASYPYIQTAYSLPEIRLGYTSDSTKIIAGDLGAVTLGEGIVYKQYYSEGFQFEKKLGRAFIRFNMLGTGLTAADDVYYISAGRPEFYFDLLWNQVVLQDKFLKYTGFLGLNFDLLGLRSGLFWELIRRQWAISFMRQFIMNRPNYYLALKTHIFFAKKDFYGIFADVLNAPDFVGNIDTERLASSYYLPDGMWRDLDNPISYIWPNTKGNMYILAGQFNFMRYFRRYAPFISLQALGINSGSWTLKAIYEVGIKANVSTFLNLYVFLSNKVANIFGIEFKDLYNLDVQYIAFLVKYNIAPFKSHLR